MVTVVVTTCYTLTMRTRTLDRRSYDDRRSSKPVAALLVRLAVGRRTDTEIAQRVADARLVGEVTDRLRAL